ncbi:MAG TPA: GNAT family N-acetyltransferase [Candidatus Eisenbacteria bacterium]|nr:GNAT family N-acetyltransferase [Candidatus Eisenbacteria bacterium]
MTEADREPGFRAFVDAYGGGPKLFESAMEVPLANRWVADDDGRIVGIMRGLPFEQAFGGRFVPSIGVAAVAVALDARSRGVGRELMMGFLRAQREARMALSVLYFSTSAPYRGVGYEIAGHRIRYALPLDYLPRKQELPVEAWGEDDLPAVNASLRRFALTQNGLIARPDWWWQTRVFKPLDDDQYLYRFLVRQGGEVRGALIYTIEKGPREDLPVAWVRESEALEVVARDLFWETPEAGRSLLAFAAGQRAMGTDLAWTGPAHDPLALLIPEHAPRFTSGYRWMGRVVHVAAALEARGYPAFLDATVELAVEDPWLPENAGVYRFRFADGRATVEGPAATAANGAGPIATVTVGGLASLFTSYATTATLVATGLLRDADAATMATLDQAFAGPSPWMLDFF